MASPAHLRPDGLRTQTGVWVNAGIITPEQAGQILALESDGGAAWRPPAELTPPAVAPPQIVDYPEPVVVAPARSSLVVEVVAYLGAALIVAAVLAILGRTWKDVPLGGRLALVGVPTVVAGVAGWFTKDRTGPVGRLASVLWLLTLGGTAAFVALVCADGTDLSPSAATTVTLGVVAPLAVVAWGFQRRTLQMLAMVGTTTGLVAASMYQAGVEFPPTIGAVVVVLGLLWFAQARVPVMEPALAGTVAGLVAAYVGCQAISAEWTSTGLALLVLGSVGLMALSIVDRSTLELLLGAFALFTSLPSLMFQWFGNSIGAALALLVCGLVLVLVALRVASTRRRTAGRPMSPGPDSSAEPPND